MRVLRRRYRRDGTRAGERPRALSRRLCAILAAAVLGAPACGATHLGAEDGIYTLKLADFFPLRHPISAEGAQYFTARVAELTAGRVRFDYFPSEQMGAAEDLLDLTRAGVVDVATVVPAYNPAKLPLSGVADLPGMVEGACEGAFAVERLMSEDGILYREDFEPADVRPLVVAVIPAYEVMTGSVPVHAPVDMRGLTLRSSGGTIDRAITELGAAPVSLPSTDTYLAVSRGTVDGLVFPPMSAEPYRLGEVVGYETIGANLGSGSITYSVSERIWDQLPADVQEAMRTAGRDTTRHLCEAVDAENAAARATMEAEGVQFYELSPEQRQQWSLALEPVRQRWAQEMESIGLPGHHAIREMADALAAAREVGR